MCDVMVVEKLAIVMVMVWVWVRAGVREKGASMCRE